MSFMDRWTDEIDIGLKRKKGERYVGGREIRYDGWLS